MFLEANYHVQKYYLLFNVIEASINIPNKNIEKRK